MNLKTIIVEYQEAWGGGKQNFHGWIYYMLSGTDYVVYQILPTQRDHVQLLKVPRHRVKTITEKIL
jgi:hypothetical protein